VRTAFVRKKSTTGGRRVHFGGLVFKTHRLVYHSTLGLRVIKKKKKVPVWVPMEEEEVPHGGGSANCREGLITWTDDAILVRGKGYACPLSSHSARWSTTLSSNGTVPHAIIWCKFGHVSPRSLGERNLRTPPCGMQLRGPLSNEPGPFKRVKASFWPWLEPFSKRKF